MASTDLTVRIVMDPDPVTVAPARPVGEVLGIMNDRRIGSVLVVRDDRRLAGIFTERDLLRRVAVAVPGWRDYPVADWMTPDPHVISPDAGWDEAVGAMDRLRVRHLPVVDAGRVVGVVSTRQLLARRAEYLNRTVAARTADLRLANDHLLARDFEVSRDLRAAGRFQRRVLLPHAPPTDPGLRWAVHYSPLDHLGGDYYDFAAPGPDLVGFLIADASGHGLPAAMVAVMARIAFGESAPATADPGAVLNAMNGRLQGLTEEKFVTALYAVFDRRAGAVRYSTAGHPPPFHYEAATGAVRPLTGQGFMLGIVPDEVYAERTAALAPGDKLCFYTDGLVEARNEIGELFGNTRLTGCLKAHGRDPADELLEHILGCQKSFSGSAPMTDDLTLAIAEIG